MNIDLNRAIEVLQACGYECEEIESLRQQLTDSQKREVILRDTLDYAARTYDSVWTKGMPIICGIVEEALVATDDLSGVILCEKEPVGYLHPMNGHSISANNLFNFQPKSIQEDWLKGTPLYRAWEPK